MFPTLLFIFQALILVEPNNTNYNNSIPLGEIINDPICYNHELDKIGGFKGLKIGQTLDKLQQQYRLDKITRPNQCGHIHVTWGTKISLSINSSKFDRYLVQDPENLTLFHSKPECIELYFYNSTLVFVSIHDAYHPAKEYAKALNSEECLVKSAYPNAERVNIKGADIVLEAEDRGFHQNKRGYDSTVFIYSERKCQAALNEIKKSKYNDF